MFSSTSREHCQSRYYKEWHPDYIAAYNSLSDPNLKHYFNHPARKNQLQRSQLVRPIHFYTVNYRVKELTVVCERLWNFIVWQVKLNTEQEEAV